ncbi:glycerol acyltransferase [Oceanospirillum linum]|uniref:Glycerol acyltransferase n=1 Tax=Oceanospirillum linum TaxID=966 RepID=A0A1T1HD57_OCELI|nr:glycerol acyltransferase [Oceanospirillum linum]SEG12200.1 1-acyl-sn-glycerol-3-phosphate acyltransferases [Oleiphilus messinensis]SMP09505.1 1-acyl-sn-glycerol-3-phosphate acyltransferases [Oceanospirillum linum]
MPKTIFTTPIISHLLYGISVLVLKLTGWQVVTNTHKTPEKAVFVAAPHTTNWDLPYALMLAFKLKLPIYWMGKTSIFRFPFGGLMRWLGGIPVERTRSTNLVDTMIDRFKAEKQLLIVIAPEGTRKKVSEWKSGFYHIACGANVPLLLGFIDYPNKRGGIGLVFQASGDYDKDLKEIKAFYAPFKGK